MRIAANLHEAMMTLFSKPHSLDLPIWIDAICINQKDDEEKNIQVARMGDVYRKATKVVVWLGPGTTQSDLAIDSLERLARDLKPISYIPEYWELQELGLSDYDSEIWSAFGDLYRRKWFGRLWVFQEAVLAPEIQVFCGAKRTEWIALANMAVELSRLALVYRCYGNRDCEKHEDGVLAMLDIDDARQRIARYGALPATFVLQRSNRKLCVDPRDRGKLIPIPICWFSTWETLEAVSGAVEVYLSVCS